jgi:hypothetical protein
METKKEHKCTGGGYDRATENGTSCSECRTARCENPEQGDPHGDESNCRECCGPETESGTAWGW